MNEKRVQEVMEIERQARELIEKAAREAERLPAEAEAEAGRIVEAGRAAARQEAQRLIDAAGSDDMSSRIVAEVQAKMAEADKLATKNLEKAIAYVLKRVAGEG